MEIYTVGHSTRSQDGLLQLLRHFELEALADIRSWPRSRRHPHFDRESLADALNRIGIEYRHLKGLGGFRKARTGSVNAGIRNAGFRGYADHMQTEEFEGELQRLVQLAEGKRTAVMCAEAVPWRCHRSYLSDTLIAQGWHVTHILGLNQTRAHRLSRGARVQNGKVIYP